MWTCSKKTEHRGFAASGRIRGMRNILQGTLVTDRARPGCRGDLRSRPLVYASFSTSTRAAIEDERIPSILRRLLR